jgi:predicted secreted protein
MTKIGKAAVHTAAALVIGCNCVKAQSASPTPEGATILHLAASASVPASPDQLVVDMVAQMTSPSAAAAQLRVNALITDCMQTARSVAGVEARAVGYSAAPSDEKRTAWVAQQTLELRGADGQALLALAGRLQEKGLLTASLDWQLSPGLRRKAHDEATTAALKELQARAASAAATLGLRVDHATDIRLDSAFNQPRPSFAMTAMASRSAPPPQATAAPEDVTANVSADVLLRP